MHFDTTEVVVMALKSAVDRGHRYRKCNGHVPHILLPLCLWLLKTVTVEWRLSHEGLTQSEPVGDEDERVQIFCPSRAWTITWTVCK